ncbi:amidase family protein [Desemzia incerta]|uniref:amidase family protein n=1 Tax=Desemzia incerta TaxID=82801 RepID=UPI0024C42395|nr:amidase family protein [Desemzia incerta]WHZ32891.1 amidase family protein [Desemzia incerta]
MNNRSVIDASKKSFLALKNPYHSVIKSFPEVINHFNESSADYRYVGIKNKKHIPHSLLNKLNKNGNYLLHTVDAYSLGGRAIDIALKNPISGRPMTGSSSGTAINVLVGINDLGIGTDGGGSVLAPAIAVNLFGFISNLIEEDHVKQFSNQSTDNISFTVSIGYMTRTFTEMQKAVDATFAEWNEIEYNTQDLTIFTLNTQKSNHTLSKLLPYNNITSLVHPDILGPREPLIEFLNSHLEKCAFLISEEGPIDYFGIGDTIIGHMGKETSLQQRLGKKGLVRVVNMANATAIVVPKKDFATGYVLICESTPAKIRAMLKSAEKLSLPPDELTHTYLANFCHYFPEEFI